MALSGGVHILVKDVDELNGLRRAVVFYNPTDTTAEASLDLRDADLSGITAVRNVFDRQDEPLPADNRLRVSVPRHGCRIYLLTATRRLDRQRYEAETAYITAYQELWNNQARGTGVYEYDPQCSSGMKATWLGRSPQNDLQWRNVYVRKGGKRTLTFRCLSSEEREFTLSVNGRDVKTFRVEGNASVSVEVKMSRGNNTIRLHNDTAPMPDIDCMTME